MKTLKEHVIIYDAVCPICNLYTKAFVDFQFLDKQGRGSYQKMPESLSCFVDQQRAVNEIALVNTRTGAATYGVQSLLKILGNRYPFLKAIFQFKVFNWLVSKLCGFVSYNRRVIMPPVQAQPKQFEPSLHKRYRIAYLFVTWLITAIILNNYSKTLLPIVPESNLLRELLVCGGQMLWQGVVVYYIKKGKTWDYLGNMMTISFAGAFLLGFFQLIQSAFSIANNYFSLGYFFLVVGLMFLEHVRRTKLHQLTLSVTISWLLYRCMVLIFII